MDADDYKYEQCSACGQYHLLTLPCPKQPQRAAEALGGRWPHQTSLDRPQAARRRLRPWEGARSPGACATLVLRAASPAPAGRAALTGNDETVTERGRRTMTELLAKNVKGHTGRHTATKASLAMRIKRGANTGVIALVALAAIALGA